MISKVVSRAHARRASGRSQETPEAGELTRPGPPDADAFEPGREAGKHAAAARPPDTGREQMLSGMLRERYGPGKLGLPEDAIERLVRYHEALNEQLRCYDCGHAHKTSLFEAAQFVAEALKKDPTAGDTLVGGAELAYVDQLEALVKAAGSLQPVDELNRLLRD